MIAGLYLNQKSGHRTRKIEFRSDFDPVRYAVRTFLFLSTTIVGSKSRCAEYDVFIYYLFNIRI